MPIVKLALFIAFTLVGLVLTGLTGLKFTDYQQELRQIEAIAVKPVEKSDWPLSESTGLFKQAYYFFVKYSLTGRQLDMENADAAFEKALAGLGANVDLTLLHAAFNLKLHRLPAAKNDLDKLSSLQDNPKVQVLRADIAVQQGDYSSALNSYRSLLETTRNWDNLSRLANLQAKLGDLPAAEELYQQAEAEISAKDMRSYAWVELQLGYLLLTHGQSAAALTHYQKAQQAYSGYWLTKDYLAEWLATQQNYVEAIALYKQLVACTHRPEIYHTLGDLYLFMGKSELARTWHDKALSIYLASAQRGEVQYYHQLTALYADALQDGAQALLWAQKDYQLRQNTGTQEAVAWALYRDGQYTAAMAAIKPALAVNWAESHLYFHAAMIYLAAGQLEQGQAYMQKAVSLNPQYAAFHAHR